MALLVRRLTSELDSALLEFLGNEEEGRGVCFCAAWWVPTWEEWPDRTAEQNRALREELLARGERDGYLLLDEEAVVGWCQVGPRDRLPKLVAQHRLAPDPEAWAVTCFEIAPSHRGRGAATHLLRGVVEDLKARGARRVEGFPACGAGLDAGEAWTGSEGLFRSVGFREIARGERRSVVELRLQGEGVT